MATSLHRVSDAVYELAECVVAEDTVENAVEDERADRQRTERLRNCNEQPDTSAYEH